MSMNQNGRPPFPPFTRETATQKVPDEHVGLSDLGL
jgi:hypothetical protein